MTTHNYKNAKANQVYDLENSDFFNNDILNYNTVHLAYNVHKIIEYPLNNTYEGYLSTLYQDGWQLVCHSCISDETSAYNLRAAVFINKSKNALHFAFAGTDPSSCNDLLDDFYIYCNKTVNKLTPMQSLINKLYEAIGVEEIANYSISSSGHSLGGGLSDLLAAEILSRGMNFTTSTTFDNPGSKPIIEAAIQNNLLTGSKELCLNDVAKHCTAFLAKPNFINSTNAQLADDIRLVVQNESKQSEYEHGQLGWTSFLYNMVGTACNTVAEFLGINNVIRGINEHKLSSFADYKDCALKVSQWIEYDKKSGYYNPTPIMLEEDNPVLALKLKDTQHSTKKDVLLVSEVEGYTKADWIAYSQLAEVQNIQPPQENIEDDDKWVDAKDSVNAEDEDDRVTLPSDDEGYDSQDESDSSPQLVEAKNIQPPQENIEDDDKWVDAKDSVNAEDEDDWVTLPSDDEGYDSQDESDSSPQLVEAKNIQPPQENIEDDDKWVDAKDSVNAEDEDDWVTFPSGDGNHYQEHISQEVSGQSFELEI